MPEIIGYIKHGKKLSLIVFRNVHNSPACMAKVWEIRVWFSGLSIIGISRYCCNHNPFKI